MIYKKCPKCKEVKPLSNFGNRHGRQCQFYCKKCHSEYNSKWYKDNAGRAAANHRRVCRRTTLRTSNKTFTGLHKRPYTGFCEICGVVREARLHYHHWDDHNPSRGIWICAYCHRLVEFFEKGLMEKYVDRYLMLKVQVNESVEEDNL